MRAIFTASIFSCAWILCLTASAVSQTATTAPGATATASASQRQAQMDLAIKVHSLIEQAVKATRQPKEANRLLEEAARMAAHIKDPEAAKLAVFTFDAKDVSLDHIGPRSIVATEKASVLTGRLKLVERGRRISYSFRGMVDNGKGFIIALPIETDEAVSQELQHDGRAIYTVTSPQPWKKFHASPDSRLVAIEDSQQAQPILILDTATRKTLAVPQPEGIDGHYNVYALKFSKWSADSKSFEATVSGFTRSKGKMMDYREIWQVDSSNGKARRLSHTEEPTPDDAPMGTGMD